ncbi:MAG: S9 family peptidase [Planctomycetota bacterium]|jgi:dipeptidyl aminopeptidase/acylaminoacyl peptidase
MQSKTTLAVLSLLVFAVPSFAQATATQEPKTELKTLTVEDYGKWNRVNSTAISPDGRWLSYAYDPNDGDANLYLAQVDGDKKYEQKGGGRPAFSKDSKWFAYMISPPEKKAEALRKKGEPVVQACEFVEIATGEKRKFDAVASFRFAESSKYLAMHKRPADRKAKHKGADLILVELEGGAAYNLGNVSSYAFNEEGSLLAFAVDADNGAGNGIYLRDLASGRVTALDSSDKRYEQLSWNEEANDLACLRGEEVEDHEERANDLLAFFDLDSENPRRVAYLPGEDESFTEGFVLSEKRGLSWSEDRKRVFFGIREQQMKPDAKKKDKKEGEEEEKEGEGSEEKKGKDEEPEKKDKPKKDEPRSNVEVWHWKDERVQSTQKVRANGDRRSTHLAVLHVATEPKFVRLADENMTNVSTSESPRWGLGRDDSAYRGDMSADGGRADYYRVSLETGERDLLAETVRRNMGNSPDGKWWVFSRDAVVMAMEVESKRTINLSEISGQDFANREGGRTSELGTYGIAGWSEDGQHVILNHRYDLWLLPLDATASDEREDSAVAASNLTGGMGSAEKIRFRYQRTDPEEEYIDLSEPMLLSAYGDWSKHSGFYRLAAGGKPEALVYADAMIGGVRKAESADRMLFTRQTFTEYPDLWVADAEFEGAKKLTDANPQQAEYRWSPGRRLIEYRDQRGNELQATLTLPAGYEEGKRYPMLVYFYERMSQRHHQYSMPSYDDRPHMSTYSSGGYLVLMPDIVYTAGKPGSSALDDVTAAAKKVIDLGYADPERIGLQGHSWGGYESSYIVTQTDMFACVVTGAPLTNLVSMHNILYKRSGNPNAPLIEWGQGRMATNPVENLAAYVDQSPVHHANKISTPFMILHGTDDGAVDWNQGLEFYIAAKRFGKEVILLSYPGEPHHLRKKENQIDFQKRMRQYFDHHLKGSEAPPWLAEGLDYLDREREKR